MPTAHEKVSFETFTFGLRQGRLRQARRRDGRYLLRTNLEQDDPGQAWQFHMQLSQVEEAFKNLKGDLAVRPIYHQLERRIEAHICGSFLACCMHVEPAGNGAVTGAGPERAQRAGEVWHTTNARRAFSVERRTEINLPPPHAAGRRPEAVADAVEVDAARTTAAVDQRQARTGNVGQTFWEADRISRHWRRFTPPVAKVGLANGHIRILDLREIDGSELHPPRRAKAA